jgi:hypothetical protein
VGNGIGIRVKDSIDVGVGGGGDGNIIAYNSSSGVYIYDHANAMISRNSIFSNSIGIDEHFYSAPSISGANPLTGMACPLCTVEVFSDSDGQGRLYEGSTQADGSGHWTFSGSLVGPDTTATETELIQGLGHTYEFSQPLVLPATPTPSASPAPTPTQSPSPTPTPLSSASPTASSTPTPFASPSATPTLTPTPAPTGIKGDANCSGIVEIGDVVADLTQQAHVSPGAQCADEANVDCDTDIDTEDALRILDYIAEAALQPPSGCEQIGT